MLVNMQGKAKEYFGIEWNRDPYRRPTPEERKDYRNAMKGIKEDGHKTESEAEAERRKLNKEWQGKTRIYRYIPF